MSAPDYALGGRRISVVYLRHDIEKAVLKIFLRSAGRFMVTYAALIAIPSTTTLIIVLALYGKMFFTYMIHIPALRQCVKQCDKLYADLTIALGKGTRLTDAELVAIDMRFEVIKQSSQIVKLL